MPSLVPRPIFEGRREKGLVHIACACAGITGAFHDNLPQDYAHIHA